MLNVCYTLISGSELTNSVSVDVFTTASSVIIMLGEMWKEKAKVHKHLFSLINVSPAQILFIFQFFRYCNILHWCSAEMSLNPELHFLSCSNKGKKRKSNNIPHTTLLCKLLLQQRDLSKGLLLLVSGFVMWLGCYLLAHKAGERNLAAGNREGEMKAVPHG